MSLGSVASLPEKICFREYEEFKRSVEKVLKETKNTRRQVLPLSSILPALTFPSGTWTLREQDGKAVSVIERSVERVVSEVILFK